MKILIVDDEAVVRIGLKSMINWEEHGYSLIGEVSNGEKALEIIKKQSPNIVITDIKMPVMDGLELIRETKKLNSVIKFVVLSSYEDFHYVKEAMKLGVEDYLLKLEMEPENLLNVLKKIELDIEKQENEQNVQMHYHNQVNINLPIMKSKFFNDIISGYSINEKDFYDRVKFLKIDLNINSIYCMVIKTEKDFKIGNALEDETDLLSTSIISLIEEIVNDGFKGYCFKRKEKLFCVLFSYKEQREGFINNTIVQNASRIVEMLQQYLNISAVIGISEINNGINGIKNSYVQSSDALKHRFFNEGKIFSYSKIADNTQGLLHNEYSILLYKERLQKALSFYQQDELNCIFISILTDISKLHLSQQVVCGTVLHLFYMVSEFLERYQLNTKSILCKSFMPYEELVLIDSFSEIKIWMDKMLEDLSDFIRKEEGNEYSKIITSAQKYIEDNYMNDISLKEVANQVNLNTSYFSTIFKQYVGISYTDYITEIRIEKGKKLLNESDSKVYEISEMVGYQNSYYFNRVFKKVTGMTPVEYKNLKKV